MSVKTERADTMFTPQLPLEGWVAGIYGFGFRCPIQGRLANFREIMDWEPPEDWGQHQRERAIDRKKKLEHVFLGEVRQRPTVLFIPESRPDELWEVERERFFLDEEECRRWCEKDTARVPDIREILADNQIMETAEPVLESGRDKAVFTAPRTGTYVVQTGEDGNLVFRIKQLRAGQSLELPFGMVGDSITLMPDTAKGKPMRCYAVNISVPTVEPLDIVPPYQVMAGGRVDKPDDDRPIFQQFSEAKAELVRLLQEKKAVVQSQIKAARKLNRGKINAMAEAREVVAAPADGQ